MDAVKVLVTSQKGGVGKSTIAANLAAYFAIDRQLRTRLVDFDHQATAVSWVRDCAAQDGRLSGTFVDLPNAKGGGLAILHAKQALRHACSDAQVVVADLTWSAVLANDYLLEYDVILVPTSLSKIELASTLCFVEDISAVFCASHRRPPELVVVPSRVGNRLEYQEVIANMSWPVRFHLAPPVNYSIAAQKGFRREFFICSGNGALRGNFLEFCRAIDAFIGKRPHADPSPRLPAQPLSASVVLNRFLAQRSVEKKQADPVAVLPAKGRSILSFLLNRRASP